ncbi:MULTISPECIES: nucleotidyl transferase AbiEii/AbiGii toxin family protein [unclassified Spirillospora]|uniref:nucleotidyl transferase AbiEii/AbiGii toxin family protein n=1 Tax=unclassified Spirillospora TaxID=2642701 RepID=UPI0034040DF6
MNGDRESSARRRAAHRAALDHVLGLVAGAEWCASLVLRGSMSMCAWAGNLAREPADLDFVVLPESTWRPDELDPYPYVDRFDVVQQWPEAAWGATEYDIWMDGEEEFETRGLHPRVSPDGLHWEIDATPAAPPYGDLLDLLRQRPRAAPDVMIQADHAQVDGDWGYAYNDAGGDETAGSRVIIPWRAEGLPPGQVQLDFAADERLPEPPVWSLVPRADGRAPAVLRTASRELSLAWKLLWLQTDAATGTRSRSKDLYDAVLLAEDDRTRLAPHLLRTVFRRRATDDFELEAIRLEDTDWAAFTAEHPRVHGTARQWLQRLGTALAPMLAVRDETD